MTILETGPRAAAGRDRLHGVYKSIRAYTERLAACLSPEDQCVQSMPDASPAKWHRAHTTWFFETFVAIPSIAGYQPHDPRFQVLFNSYYQAVGPRHPRPARGLLTRPDAAEVGNYRRVVDEAILAAFDDLPAEAVALIELGVQHEQQHQELLQSQTSCMPSRKARSFPACDAGVGGSRRAPPGPRRVIVAMEAAALHRIWAHRESALGDFCFDSETTAASGCCWNHSPHRVPPGAQCENGRRSWRMAAMARAAL